MKILVTGAAGFIGFHIARRFLGRGDSVVGIDNLNSYYPVELKCARLAELGIRDAASTLAESRRGDGSYPAPSRFCGKFRFYLCDIADKEVLPAVFERERFDVVVNMAAQAGVRHSIEAPFEYSDSNLVGFLNVLECCRRFRVSHLVYASSSSVYGDRRDLCACPAGSDSPVSLYAATKKAGELMAYSYSRLYGIPATGLRLFSVYGPWGRPDMAPSIFAGAILGGKPLKVFNGGDMTRDFTYIDDAVEAVLRVVDNPPVSVEDAESAPSRLYDVGRGAPVALMDFIGEMESACGRKACLEMLPMQPGDVRSTSADTAPLERDYGFRPKVAISEGVAKFVDWYKSDKNPLK